MDPASWRLVESLYHAAMERDAGERSAFLAEACPDVEVRLQVESLIRSGETSQLIAGAVGGAVGPRADPRPGEWLGPYRTVKRVGVGGMGEVWLAERSDEHFRRRVALKLIRRGLIGAEIVERFLLERQVLAQLQHPNIAALLDGGATDDGLPYLVMEYVEGIPIDVYCDEGRLPIGERLRLFRKVCGAVHHAHRNLVVHRDLKPSNVLVTSEGEPKLLDFGIAKILAGHASHDGRDLTLTATRLMTPRYASPEQVRAEAITTASDVYQLGVVLYELLCGRPPYELTTTDPLELARIVCEEEPSRPSSTASIEPTGKAPDSRPSARAIAAARATDVRRMERKLAGDLDAILLTALRKEPQRRYSSAEQLSADLGRHLAGHSVLARPDSWRYRAGTFARRNRAAVAAGVGTLAVLLLGIAVTTAAMLRAQRAERAARAESAQATAATDFLLDVFRISDPSEARGNAVTAREILDRGAAQISRELDDQPEVQARLTATIGQVYEGLGLYEKATALLEEAVALYERTLGATDPNTLASQHDLAVHYMVRGRHREAEALLLATLETQRRVLGDDDPATLRTRNNVASLYWRTGRLEEAEAIFVETLEIQRRTLSGDHRDTLMTLSNLAILYNELSRLDEAEALYVECLSASRRVLGGDHPVTLKNMHNLGMLYKARGRDGEAEALLSQTLAAKRRVLGDEHLTTLTSRNALAEIYYDRGEYERAGRLWGENLEVSRRINGNDHPATFRYADNLALAHHGLGLYEAATALYLEALEGRQRTLGPEHPEVGITAHNLANLRRDTGDRRRARSLYERAQKIFERHYGPHHPYVAENLDQYADLLRLEGDEQGAEGMEARALRIRAGKAGAAPKRGYSSD